MYDFGRLVLWNMSVCCGLFLSVIVVKTFAL